ncbi:hypothetical protein ES703_01266 [subsurface metagenome]
MVKAYGSFDESMTRSLAIMGDVSAAMRDKMAKTAKQLSTETTFAAKDLAEAYFFLASAGMNAEQSISALEPVARFAQAGTFDLAQATDLLTDAQTALGLSSKDVIENEKNLIRVSDVLVGANTLANASVLQFSESLTNKAAAALIPLNKEVEEGVAVLAAYADKGIKGRLAGNRLTMMLNGLFAATQQNKKAWDDAGISLWDTAGNMRHMGDIIQDLEGYLGDMTPEQRTAELAMLGFNIKTKDSILALLGSSEKIKLWTEKLKKMGGITKIVSDKQLEAFNAKMTIAKNTVMLAAMAIGKSLAPMIVKLAGKIKSVAERITKWIEKHPKLTEWIAKLALGIGALLLVLGPLLIMLPGIAAGMMLLEKSATLMAIKVKVLTAAKTAWAIVNAKLGLSFTMLLGPIGLVIAAAVTAGIIINKIIDNYKKKQDAEMDAMILASKGHARYWAFRRKMIATEIVTVKEWAEIYNKHGRDYRRVMIAISKLPEYAHIKAELDAIIKKEKELAEGTRTNSEEIVSLMSKMADEIFKATHNEFEVRRRLARRTWEERKTLLDLEKAADDAYVMAKKAYTIELNQIEEDRKEKVKEGWAEIGKSVTAGLLKWHAEEKKFASIIKKYRDIVSKLTSSAKDHELAMLKDRYEAEKQMLKDTYGETQKYHDAMIELNASYDAERAEILEKSEKKFASIIKRYRDIGKEHALSEKEYKLDQLEGWYTTEEQKLWELYGDTQKYYDAMEALDTAAEARRKGILAETPAAWMETFDKILGDAAMFTSALGGLFNQITENQMMNIEKEYEARKAAIDNSLMTEKSKTDAMAKLDKEFEKKRKKAQRDAAVRTKLVGVMEAIIHTASAIVEALPNIPLAIAVGIMGAAQTALIAAQPLPSFQRGGRIEEAGIVGEAGPELFVPGRPGEIIPIRERARALGAQVVLTFSPTFYLSTLDPQTARDVVRDQIGPEMLEMFKTKILLPEFQTALGIR